jgi:hypothetical protein
MKAFLNLSGQLDEINFGDSRFALEYDAVGFNATDRRVFVFFAANGFEASAKMSDADSVARIAMIVFRGVTVRGFCLFALHTAMTK